MLRAMKLMIDERAKLQRELAADPRYARVTQLTHAIEVLEGFEPKARSAKAHTTVRGVSDMLSISPLKQGPKPKKVKKARFVMPAILKVLHQASEPLDFDQLVTRVVEAGGVEATDPYPKRTLAVVLAGGARYGRLRQTPHGWKLTAKGIKEATANGHVDQ